MRLKHLTQSLPCLRLHLMLEAGLVLSITVAVVAFWGDKLSTSRVYLEPIAALSAATAWIAMGAFYLTRYEVIGLLTWILITTSLASYLGLMLRQDRGEEPSSETPPAPTPPSHDERSPNSGERVLVK